MQKHAHFAQTAWNEQDPAAAHLHHSKSWRQHVNKDALTRKKSTQNERDRKSLKFTRKDTIEKKEKIK